MKLNWKTFKVVFALVVVLGAVFWAVDSVRSRSYSGSNLNVDVGSGSVSVTNPSDQPVTVQVFGTGSRPFTVSSTTEGLSGSSARQGTGSSSTNFLEFVLPPGISEFTIARGANVKFVANTPTQLQVTVNPLTADESRTTLITAGVVVLGSLFYASKSINHGWITMLRRQKASIQDTQPIAVRVAADANRGRDGRLYSDS